MYIRDYIASRESHVWTAQDTAEVLRVLGEIDQVAQGVRALNVFPATETAQGAIYAGLPAVCILRAASDAS